MNDNLDNIKEKLLSSYSDLKFNEEYHRYYLDDKVIPSTSNKLKNFYEPFNCDIAKYIAGKGKYKNMTEFDIRKEWDNKRKNSTDFGTKIHNFAEDYAYKAIKPCNESELGVIQWWMDKPEHIHLLATELTMYSREFNFGGTADIILYNEQDDSIIIGDYKTNEDLFKNYKNKKMLEPFNDLLDCPYNKYQLQFSHYQLCLEEKGFKVSRRILVHLIHDQVTGKYYINYDTDNLTNKIKEYYGHCTTTY